jgi:hypothetical protein
MPSSPPIGMMVRSPFEEMAEAENGALSVFDVMPGHQADAVAQLFTCRQESVSGIDLAPIFFSQRVQRRPRDDAFCAKPANQLRNLAMAAVVDIKREGIRGIIRLDHELAPSAERDSRGRVR